MMCAVPSLMSLLLQNNEYSCVDPYTLHHKMAKSLLLCIDPADNQC